MVETIHMKQRMMGVTFSIKTREAKDRYVDSNFKNFLEELSIDLANYVQIYYYVNYFYHQFHYK